MDFVVNFLKTNLVNIKAAINLPVNQIVWIVSTNLAMPVVVMLSFLISKKFINTELKNGTEKSWFKYFLAFIPALLIAPTVVYICFSIITVLCKSFLQAGLDCVPDGFLTFSIMFSLIITAAYGIAVPYHPGHRIIEIEDRVALGIFKKNRRMSIITLLIASLAAISGSLLKNSPSIMVFEILFIMMALGYVYIELCLEKENICKIIRVRDDKYSCATVQLVRFINDKIVYISSLTTLAILVNDIILTERKDFLFFVVMNGVLKTILCLVIIQAVVSIVLEKFLSYIESHESKKNQGEQLNKRQRNLLTVCNMTIISFYAVIVYFFALGTVDFSIRNLFYDKLITTILILAITVAVVKVYDEIKEEVLLKSQRKSPVTRARVLTFAPIVTAIFYTLITMISILIILANWGADVVAILVWLATVIAALSFATKRIVEALFKGVIMLCEENLFIGEYVKVGGVSGVIEKLSIRCMYLRNEDGSLNVVPYDQVTTIVNLSKDYSYCADTLRITVDQDVDAVIDILNEVIDEMRREDAYKEKILSEVTIHGIMPIDLTGVQISWQVKTLPGNPHLKHEIYRRLLIKFRKKGITIPSVPFLSLPLPTK